MFRNCIHFFKEEIWLLPEHQLPLVQQVLIKALKIVLLAYQGFNRDSCQLRASALTLYSLLAIVPVIALLFGIAKGFGLEQMLQQQLLKQIPPHDLTLLQLIKFGQNLLESTKGEVVAGIGVIVLLWSAINMISNIEQSFNYIWKISKGRSLTRKLSDYLSLMLLAPVLLILSGSISVFLNTKITWLAAVITLPEFGEGLLLRALSYSPLLLLIGLFSITLIFMPNHKVNTTAGIVAGAITGILYHFVQWLYLSLQIGVSSYNAVYGSFAALPLFVVWIQLGWMVVLFGCEIAFFIQNYESHREYHQFSALSFASKKMLALQAMHLIIKNFVNQAEALTAEQVSIKLAISIAFIQPVLEMLVASHLLIEINTQDDDSRYQPALDINILSVSMVINLLEQLGQTSVSALSQERYAVELLKQGDDGVLLNQNRLLKDL